MTRYPIFDLDGTLLDSDDALVRPFLDLGIERERITFGLPLAEECARLGVDLDDYLARYDTSAAQPFPGVGELVASLDAWSVCSNKYPAAGRAELARLGWEPEAAVFFGDRTTTKELGPVLHHLGLDGSGVLFVGDTDHDRECARAVGAAFVLAAWNPRSTPRDGEAVAVSPADVLGLL